MQNRKAKDMGKLLNADYASIHGTYWMYYGIICSFASVFLLATGYSNSEIGLILAIGNVAAVILQPIVADFADRSKRFTLIGISQMAVMLLMVLTLGMLVFSHRSFMLSFVFVMMVAWLNVIQPLFNSLNFKLEECGVHINFGMCRSMGSLCYAVLCAVLGGFVESMGIVVLPVSGEVALVLLMISLVVTKLHFNKANRSGMHGVTNAQEQVTDTKEWSEEKLEDEINLFEFIKRNKMFLLVNIGVFGVFFSNSALNNFMIQIVENVGGNSADMGKIFGVMAFLEIPTMFCFDWFKKRFSSSFMLKAASVFFTIKIGCCYLADSVTMVYVAQIFQLFSFALFLPAMVDFINSIMSKGEAVKGQALYTMMVTVASVAASLAGGVMLDMSGAKLLTLVSTIITGLGTLIIIFTVDKVKKNI